MLFDELRRYRRVAFSGCGVRYGLCAGNFGSRGHVSMNPSVRVVGALFTLLLREIGAGEL